MLLGAACPGSKGIPPATSAILLMISERLPRSLSILIRPTSVDDATGLHARCWPDRPRDVVVGLLRRAEQLARYRRGLGVTAVLSGQPCGFALLTLWPRCAEISDLIVSEPLRGQRIGTQLVEYLATAARDLGASVLEIGAALSNPRAIALYRRLGFVDGRIIEIDLGSGPEPVLYLYRTLTL